MKAQCCWPEVDILLSLKGSSLYLYEKPRRHPTTLLGIATEGGIELTKEEAIDLVKELNTAITNLSEIEESLDKYMEKNL